MARHCFDHERGKTSRMGNKICGCASEEAPNQLTATEMMQVLSPATREQAIASVTAKTVTACFKTTLQIIVQTAFF